MVELIAAKRDGKRLAPEDISRLVQSLSSGALADYQMTAWLMRLLPRVGRRGDRGPHPRHARERTNARPREHTGVKVDKHSTGGVGDKVSIALAPLVAACGVPVPMVSGRGLGHTGGTLDKLEAIPGFRTQLSTADFTRIVGQVGCCMIGQTGEIAPADKRIYALRDVTATVESIRSSWRRYCRRSSQRASTHSFWTSRSAQGRS